MKTGSVVLAPIFIWISLVTAWARVFDAEAEYIRLYGANVNKGVPAPPPYKFAIYHKKNLRILVLFENQVSQGELISKPNARLTDKDVPGILAANQGSSVWKKEHVETTKDPKALQISAWSRADGKLFAAYVSNSPIPVLVIGTRSGGEFLMREQKRLATYVKD
jgi:hypothetical protein